MEFVKNWGTFFLEKDIKIHKFQKTVIYFYSGKDGGKIVYNENKAADIMYSFHTSFCFKFNFPRQKIVYSKK